MLVVVLILMLAGFGMLVFASLTGTVAWAWISVAASVAGAVFLVMGWRRRAAMTDDRPAGPTALPTPASEEPWAPPSSAGHQEPVAEAARPSSERPSQRSPQEPGEEHADPADLAFVATLDRQVLVVDELPGYHLAGCPVLSGRGVIGLPAREAVALGFTPCAVCAPIRVLASAGSRREHSSAKRR